jgi:hypothetical protein
MSIYDICVALHNSEIGTSIRESIWVFPIIETIHVLGVALSAGLILMLDLRLSGLGMRKVPAGEIMHRLKPWYLIGFAIMMISGALLFWSEAEKLYSSFTFRMKLVFLITAGLNALVFEILYTPKMAEWETKPIPTGAKWAGWISLISWAAVIGYGRWTAYGLG